VVLLTVQQDEIRIKMVEMVKGNLLDAKAEALVNTVNTVGIMGKGIALQFRQAFPRNFEIYQSACKRGEVVPGKMFVVPTNRLDNPKYIINFPTKRHWRGKSQIEDIDSGLLDLVRVVRQEGIRSIAIPPLGCGNGGLDWGDVRPRILKALAGLPDVEILLYGPGGAPQAEDMAVATKKPAMNPNRAALIAMMMNYGEAGYRLTLLEIQKLAYFLQLAGQPLKLDFLKQQYGPYAESLNHVLQRLEGHFIRGYGDRSRDASVRILPEASEEAGRFLAGDEATLGRIERVRELIEGFETPYGMELLATVHWVAGEDAAFRSDTDRLVEAVHAWNERKARIFSPAHIRTAHARLVSLGWV
jgi:O-acetyl-ADP-ribose deacetylase (regulator of RNase III)